MKITDLNALSASGALAKIRGLDARAIGIGRAMKLKPILDFVEESLRNYYQARQSIQREFGEEYSYTDENGHEQKGVRIPKRRQEAAQEALDRLNEGSVEMATEIEPFLTLDDFYSEDAPEESYKLTVDQAIALVNLGVLKTEEANGGEKQRRKSENDRKAG